jgi:hypothetical protein
MTVLFATAFRAEADVNLTFYNKTNRKVSIVVYRELAAFHVKGWFNVEPGKSRTITFKTEQGEPAGDVGYYAEATKKGQKTIYWQGDFARAWVHPSKAFEYRGGYQGADDSDFDNFTAGPPNKRVGFRKISIKSMQGTVNLTSN